MRGASSRIIPTTSPRAARCSRAMRRRDRLSAPEWEKLPLLARGAALRFLLTRLVDWLDVPPGALVRPKDPIEYLRKLRFHQKAKSAHDYGVMSGVTAQLPHVVIHTDGACSGNPGPGGWGAILAFGDHEKEIKGRRGANHQQPHGTDGRDLCARIAEAAVPRRSAHRQPISAQRRHVLDVQLEAKRLADVRQEAGEERRSVEASRCGAWAASDAVALAARPHRSRPERTRRRIGAQAIAEIRGDGLFGECCCRRHGRTRQKRTRRCLQRAAGRSGQQTKATRTAWPAARDQSSAGRGVRVAEKFVTSA